MFSKAFRKTYNLNKYSKLSDVDPHYTFTTHHSANDFKKSHMALFFISASFGLHLYANPEPFYELFTHFQEPSRSPLYWMYPSSVTNGNMELIERMRLSNQLNRYIQLSTAYHPEDYA